jgi:diacylglycerol kinase family enzyme
MTALDGTAPRPDLEARPEPRAVDSAAPFFIVMNAGSGHAEAAEARAVLEQELRSAGRAFELAVVEDAARLHDIALATVSRARARGGVVVVAGGDGTINAVVNASYGSGCPLGILPRGTFNYFSREHGIPADTRAAVQVLLTARAHPVQVGLVNGRVFLVNASLGLYPQLLEDREGFKQRLGRRRWVALVSAIVTVLRHRRELTLDVEYAGRTRVVRTRTLFVGNNELQLEQVGIPEAPAIENGRLVGLVVRPAGVAELLWLIVRGALGTLGDAEQVGHFAFRRIVVRPRRARRQLKVAADGEITRVAAPIEFTVGPEPLYVLKPEGGGSGRR